jgi:hypothetical protein
VNYAPVSVKWSDAHADRLATSWTDPKQIEDTGPYIITTVGVLLEGLKEGHVSVAQSYDRETNVDTVLHIPTDMVKEIVFLTTNESQGYAMTRRDMEIILYFLERVVPKGREEESKLSRIIALLNKKAKNATE